MKGELKEHEEKEEEENPKKTTILRELSRLHYELSLLYEKIGSMRNFYLKESHTYLSRIVNETSHSKEDIKRLVRIFLKFHLIDQALHTLEIYCDESDPFALLLKAEIQYERRDYNSVFRICTWLLQREEQLDETDRRLISYWLGH